MRKWLLGGVMVWVALVGCIVTGILPVMREPENPPDPVPLTATKLVRTVDANTPTSDAFLQTATKILYNATQTGEYVFANCETNSITSWSIGYQLLNEKDAEPVFINDNVTYIYYDCPSDDEYWHREYILHINVPDLSNRNRVVQLIEDLIGQLRFYPPDDSPMLDEYLVSLVIFAPYQVGAPHEFTYDDAIAAYESGLRGEELLDALEIELSE